MSTTHTQPESVAPDEPGEPAGLDRTEIYDVLSNERRTMVLELLAAEDSRDLADLAEHLAAAETGERPPPEKKRTSVYVTLHQTHLPKLDDLDVVDYDESEKVVSLGARASSVLSRRYGEGDDARTGESALGASVASLALVALGLTLAGASVVGLPVVGLVAPGVYALGTLVCLLAVLAFGVGRDAEAVAELLTSPE